MKPILFNTDMVRAILDGRKTVTRRVVKPQPNNTFDRYYECFTAENDEMIVLREPYYPGDVLHVRETWYKDAGRYMYRADYSDAEKFYINGRETIIRWHPSIHMPREAARIFLRVTDVRVERLQEMTEYDAYAEGCCDENDYGSKQLFADVWDSTIKPADRGRYGWAANPFVWVIEFERCEKPEEVNNGNS